MPDSSGLDSRIPAPALDQGAPQQDLSRRPPRRRKKKPESEPGPPTPDREPKRPPRRKDVGSRLDILACCYYIAGKRKQAIATAERCKELDPKNEHYPQRLAMFKEGK